MVASRRIFHKINHFLRRCKVMLF